MLKCLYAAIPYALLSLSGPLRALSRCGSTPLQNGSTPSRLLAFHWGSWWRSSLRAFLSSFWLPKRRRPSVPSPTPSRMRSLKPMLTKRHSGGRESGRSCAAWVGFARGDYDKLGGSRRTSKSRAKRPQTKRFSRCPRFADTVGDPRFVNWRRIMKGADEMFLNRPSRYLDARR
jgi:hypothetical protein